MKLPRSQGPSRSLTLRSHAATMRDAGTASECALWQLLRNKRCGVWFRRQVVLLGSCIVDFYCPSARLIVEVDGGYHGAAAPRRADARRDWRLAKAGFTVLRLPAEVVLREPEPALAAVLTALAGQVR